MFLIDLFPIKNRRVMQKNERHYQCKWAIEALTIYNLETYKNILLPKLDDKEKPYKNEWKQRSGVTTSILKVLSNRNQT